MDTEYKRTMPPTSHEVYQWPEFIAFADRLGIPIHLRNIGVTIDMVFDGLVIVTHRIQGEDRSKAAIDTTNQHNKQWRTKRPGSQPEADQSAQVVEPSK